jgi:hypothetical protein
MRTQLLIGLMVLAVVAGTPALAGQPGKADEKTPAAAPAAVEVTGKAVDAAPAKAATPAPTPGALKVTVVSASGPAQKLTVGTGGTKWQPLKAGDVLSEMTVIRTGYGAKVVLKFEDRAEVVINNATKVGISDLRKDGDRATASIGLKYGTVHATVEGKQGSNDFRVSTPTATLSVRGSKAHLCSMADSNKFALVQLGDWNAAKKFAALLGMKPKVKNMNFGPGQTGQSTFAMPLTFAAYQRSSQARITNFGISPADVKSMVNNTTGRRGSGAPSTTDGANITQTIPVPTLPSGEPGFP